MSRCFRRTPDASSCSPSSITMYVCLCRCYAPGRVLARVIMPALAAPSLTPPPPGLANVQEGRSLLLDRRGD